MLTRIIGRSVAYSQSSIHTKQIISRMGGPKIPNNFLGGKFLGHLIQVRQHIPILRGKACSRPVTVLGQNLGPVERKIWLTIVKVKMLSLNKPYDYL